MMLQNQERNQEITRRYIAGESLSTLANVFGVDKALIWRIAVAGGAHAIPTSNELAGVHPAAKP